MGRIREIGAELIRVLKYDLDIACQKVLDAFPDPDVHVCAPEPRAHMASNVELRDTKVSYLKVVETKKS